MFGLGPVRCCQHSTTDRNHSKHTRRQTYVRTYHQLVADEGDHADEGRHRAHDHLRPRGHGLAAYRPERGDGQPHVRAPGGRLAGAQYGLGVDAHPRVLLGEAAVGDAPGRLDGQGQRRQHAHAGRDGQGEHASGRRREDGVEATEYRKGQQEAHERQEDQDQLACGSESNVSELMEATRPSTNRPRGNSHEAMTRAVAREKDNEASGPSGPQRSATLEAGPPASIGSSSSRSLEGGRGVVDHPPFDQSTACLMVSRRTCVGTGGQPRSSSATLDAVLAIRAYDRSIGSVPIVCVRRPGLARWSTTYAL